MTPRTARRLAGLIAIACAASCAPDDPWELLALSRASIDVQLINWVESVESQPGEPEAGAIEQADAAPAGATESAPGEPADPGLPAEAVRVERIAHLSILVVDRGAPLTLPCLTVDLVFEAGDGPDSREVGRVQRELDISRLEDSGGGLDLALRVPLPDQPVSAIGITLHEATLEELPRLCEAAAAPVPAD